VDCTARGRGRGASGSSVSEKLERRPSALGLDHACVCIANGTALDFRSALELQDLKSHVQEPIPKLLEQKSHQFQLSRLDPQYNLP
jgi:hypothetical protein